MRRLNNKEVESMTREEAKKLIEGLTDEQKQALFRLLTALQNEQN